MVPIYVSILSVVFPHARLIPFWKNVSYIRVYIGGVHAAIKRRACYNALTVTMCSISFSFLLPFNRPFSRNVRALRLAEAKRGQERVRARPKKVTTKFFFSRYSLQATCNVGDSKHRRRCHDSSIPGRYHLHSGLHPL